MDLVLGLGGNLGEVLRTFAWVAAEIAKLFPVKACSQVYLTEPIGPKQPMFFNAALLLELQRSPLELLELCQQWEREAGRNRDREIPWGPRPLDLDLLVTPQVVMAHPRLQLPHPRLAQRRFALLPAAEVAPNLLHPLLHRSLAQLAGDPKLSGQSCQVTGPFPCP